MSDDFSYTTLQAIAELVHNRLNPQPGDEPYIDFEDVLEEVRNQYSGVMWTIYMNGLGTDGERTVLESICNRKEFPYEGKGSIRVDGIQFANLPHDAGIYQVLAVDGSGQLVANPLTKSSVSQAYMPHRLSPGLRYYRIEQEMFFPDSLPSCTKKIIIVFMGLVDNPEEIKIPRDFASMVREKVWKVVAPGREIPVDSTNNSKVDA